MNNDNLASEITNEQIKVNKKLNILKTFTPFVSFLSLTTSIVTSIGLSPSVFDINHDFYTHLTPKSSMIIIYWIVLYSLQIGTNFLFIASQKDLTKSTLVNVLGYRFIISHILHSIYIVLFILNSFTLSTLILICQSINLLTIYLQLLHHDYTPTKSRPLDYLFIHIPIKMWFIISVILNLPHTAFIAFDWLSTPTWRFSLHQYSAFIALLIPIIIGFFIILFLRDHIWMLCHMWCLLTLFLRHPKPFIVNLNCVLGWILLPLALIANSAWERFNIRREQLNRIRLEDDAERQFERDVIYNN